MAMIEEKIRNNVDFLIKIWCRYVDDVLAILKRTHLRSFLKFINGIHPAIKFTIEMENDGKLPFLDVQVIRVGAALEFDVYRKPTATSRYICNNSQHSPQHKLSVFQSLIHRLLKFPLSPDRYDTELAYIIDVAATNGFKQSHILGLVDKKKNIEREQITTLRTNLGNCKIRKKEYCSHIPPSSRRETEKSSQQIWLYCDQQAPL